MSMIVDGVLFMISGGLLIASAVFSAEAASGLTKIPQWKDDGYLKKAHKWLSWSTFTGWISVALIITLVVLYLMFGIEESMITGGITAKFFLLLTIAAMIACGTLSAIGVADINKSSAKNLSRSNGVYQKAVWSMVLALVGGSLLFILFIYSATHHGKKGQSKEQKKEEAEVDELKKELIEKKEAELEAEKQENILEAERSRAALEQIRV